MNKAARLKAKKKLRIRLTLVYSVMVLSTLLLVTGLYFIVQGYRFNSYDGKIQQGGLVQFNSAPTGASVWLDNILLGSKTQSKLTISPGKHRVAMEKDGYHGWSKDVEVRPGRVLWLNYVRLVPKSLKTDTPLTFTTVSSSAVSHNSHKLAVIENASQPTIQLVQLDVENPQKTTITISSQQFTAPSVDGAHSFELVRWAYDNKYLLVKHVYDDKIEWLSIDTNSSTVKNITSLLGVDAVEVEYAKDDANTVFMLNSEGTVRRANIDQKTLSGPLVQQVESFSLYDSATIAYVTKPNDTTGARTAAYLTIGAEKSRTVAELPASTTSVMFKINKYFGSYYLAVNYNETVDVYTGDLSASGAENPAPFTKLTSFNISGGAAYLGFSPGEHRFLYAQNANTLVTYDLDLETKAEHTFASEQERAINWIDQFHFTAKENSALIMYDYDATNSHALLDSPDSSTAALLQNGRFIFTLRSQNNTTELVRIRLLEN